MKQKIFLVLVITIIILCFTACGDEGPDPVAFDPTPTATPVPKEVAEREELDKDAKELGKIFVEGQTVKTWTVDDTACVKYEDIFSIDGIERSQKASAWDTDYDGLYIKLSDLEDDFNLGKLSDTENGRDYYCISASKWSPARNLKIPVIYYYGLKDEDNYYSSNYIAIEDLEEQLSYIADYGFNTMWFEDLRYVVDTEDSLIIAFDEADADIYSEVFPIASRYNIKFTVFTASALIGTEDKLTETEIEEMSDSGLVSFQIRPENDIVLGQHSESTQKSEIQNSILAITRITKKIPIAIAFPGGTATDTTEKIAASYVKFGVVGASSSGKAYDTSKSSMGIKGIPASRYTDIDEFSTAISESYIEEQSYSYY